VPVTKSATKALRQSLRKAKINKPIKSQYKSALKKAQAHPGKKTLSQAYATLDKAVKNKIIHQNKAGRLKSKLAQKVNLKQKT